MSWIDASTLTPSDLVAHAAARGTVSIQRPYHLQPIVGILVRYGQSVRPNGRRRPQTTARILFSTGSSCTVDAGEVRHIWVETDGAA